MLPHPLSYPLTLSSAASSPYAAVFDAFPPSPTAPTSTFQRMRHVQSLASYDVSLGLRYVPPTGPLPPPLSPALSAVSLSTSAGYGLSSHSSSASSSLLASPFPLPHYSLFSSYPGVAVVSHTAPSLTASRTRGEARRSERDEERSNEKKNAEVKQQQAESKRTAEEERRKRQEASRQRRMGQLRRARERRAEVERKEQQREVDEGPRSYPTLEEVMPPKQQPSRARSDRSEDGGGGRTVRRQQWSDVKEAELALQRREQDERLKEERRLKQMQDKIALLKARMDLKERHSLAPSLSPSLSSASRPGRLPLTFSASPYAPLSARRHPPASPSRTHPSAPSFVSPRRRPHPFLRHSPVRRRRLSLSLSPTKQRRRTDEQQQQRMTDNTTGGQLLGLQHQHAHRRTFLSPKKARTADSPAQQLPSTAPAAHNGQHSRRGSDVVSSANLPSYLQSLVEVEIAKHISDLSLTAAQQQQPPPSPPLLRQQSMAAAQSRPLQHYTSQSVVEHLDELVADVLDRLVEDTVVELNAAEERQRANVVLDEVADMVSELERLEDTVTQRWLTGSPAQERRQRQREAAEKRGVHEPVVPWTSNEASQPPLDSSTAPFPAAVSSLSVPPPSTSSSDGARRSVPFRPRVLPVCADVSPQLADPTGVALAEQWAEQWVDDAISGVVHELWQCLDTAVEGMLEHEVG